MEIYTHKSEKTFDENRVVPIEPKPKYQAPIVMPLGELIRGRGRRCSGGLKANDGCGGGNQATGGMSCGGGNEATGGGCGGGGGFTPS
jgi:hypothetical protein